MLRVLGISSIVFVSLLLTLAWVGEPVNWPAVEPTPYQGETAKADASVHAPAALARLVREPQNAWSNLAFVIGGAFLLGKARTRGARSLGLPLISVGIGSFLYHASSSAELRQLDVGAMYWLFALTAAYCVTVAWPRWSDFLERNIVGVTIAALGVAVALTLARNMNVGGFKPLSLTVATVIVSAAMLLTLAEVARRRESVSAALQLLGVVTLFGAAVFLQRGDRPGGPLYRPDAIIQAHAAWHVLAAIVFTWTVAATDRFSTKRPPRAV